jgi:hypothetical protein
MAFAYLQAVGRLEVAKLGDVTAGITSGVGPVALPRRHRAGRVRVVLDIALIGVLALENMRILPPKSSCPWKRRYRDCP